MHWMRAGVGEGEGERPREGSGRREGGRPTALKTVGEARRWRRKTSPTGGPHLSVRGRGGRPVGPEREVGPGLLLGRAGVEQERKKGREGRENWAGLEEESHSDRKFVVFFTNTNII